MENKVIILGAGIGAMTMGFENAGCSVVAAYERDRRAIELYKKNISGEINELDQLGTSNLEDVPDIDILACDFYRDLSIVGRNPKNTTDINNAIQFILDYRKPKIICFFIPRACLKWEKFVQLLGNINNRGYDYKYKQIYTEQATGLPITEKRVYLVAIHRSLGDVFEFPCFDEKKMFSLEEILENKPVEEFYRKVNCNCVNEISTKDTFFNTKYIVFEFKNYKEKITQREIYTTEKYLYKKALRSVAIIVSREGASRNALLAAKGCLRENGKLILCLSDKDLNELIHIKEKGEQPTAEFFEAMLDDILIHLEK